MVTISYTDIYSHIVTLGTRAAQETIHTIPIQIHVDMDTKWTAFKKHSHEKLETACAPFFLSPNSKHTFADITSHTALFD